MIFQHPYDIKKPLNLIDFQGSTYKNLLILSSLTPCQPKLNYLILIKIIPINVLLICIKH